MHEVFLDTAYAIALSASTDQFHERAVELADRLETAGTRMITTQAVLLEIGNALAKQRYRLAGVRLLEALRGDANVEIVFLSSSLLDRAFLVYRQRQDKEWGLIDCVSFVVMQDRGLTDALTSDEHFEQAGYRAVLRDENL